MGLQVHSMQIESPLFLRVMDYSYSPVGDSIADELANLGCQTELARSIQLAWWAQSNPPPRRVLLKQKIHIWWAQSKSIAEKKMLSIEYHGIPTDYYQQITKIMVGTIFDTKLVPYH